MRRWPVLFIVAVWVLSSQSAMAQVKVDLEVDLVHPQDEYINIVSCETAEIEITWRLPEGNTDEWDATVKPDIFLDDSSSCDYESKAVEIGNPEDMEVGTGGVDGTHTYPEAGDPDLNVADIDTLDCVTESEVEYYVCVSFTGNSTLDGEEAVWRGGAKLTWDLKAPDAPRITSISPGEKNLKVSWEAPDDSDLAGFVIYYATQGSTDVRKKEVTDDNATSYQITGLTNYTTYDVWIKAVDETENEGLQSNTVSGTPEPVDDFYEYYRKSGGDDTGGFCFVATAAYGSYQSIMVQPLRAFRDGVLAHSQAGRAVIAGYYRYGPRWARAIRGSGAHRTVARWSLAPAVAFAEVSNRLGLAETLVLLAALLIALMLGRRFFRKHSSWARRSVPPLVVLLFLVGAPAMALEDQPDADFQLQIRLGPYYPDVDQEDSLGQGGLDGSPFKTIFGPGSEMLFELGVDYEIWHGFGTVMAGGSFGFVQYIGKALNTSGEISSDTTVFNLLPLRLNVGYHFDLLSRKFNIPLVPYLTTGVSYYIFWVLDGVGNVSEWEDEDGDTHAAQGGIFGLHLCVGLKLLLDFLDEGAAGHLHDDVGVINTYLFAEFASSWVSDFNSGERMNVGDQTFMFGLMMEF